MARVLSSSGRIIYPPNQTVTINGVVRRDVECAQIISGGNLSPVQATLLVPQAYAGDSLPWLADSLVVVTVEGRSDPIFRGVVLTEAHRENASESRVSVRAISHVGLMDKIFLGQGILQAAVKYFRSNAVTGLPSGWNLVAVLQQWFSLPVYPLDWKTQIDIGDVEALGLSGANIPFMGLRFAVTSYRDALATIMAQVPQLGIRERFTSDLTYLDFYLRNDPEAPERRIVAPLGSIGPQDGAIASAFVRESDVSGIYSRVVGFGRPVKTQITIGTRASTDARTQDWDSPFRLRPLWEDATDYVELFSQDENGDPVYSADEMKVMADPSIAIEGTPHFDATLQYHFRRFALPDAIRALWTIEQRNVFRTVRSDLAPELVGEEHIGVQVFASFVRQDEPAAPENDETKGDLLEDGFIDPTKYRLIPGAIVTEEGIIELPAPALECFFRWLKPDGTELREFNRVDVFVTLTISRSEFRPRWDTGVRGGSFPGLEQSGMVLSFINESVGFERIGTLPNEFGIPPGEEDDPPPPPTFPLHFGSAWYDPQTDQWLFVNAGAMEVVEDDTVFLAGLCETLLTERNRRRTDATIRLPACLFGYQVGDVVTLENRGINGRRLGVNTVVWDLLNPATEISASDQIVTRFTVGEMATGGASGAGRNLGAGVEAMRGAANEDPGLDPFQPENLTTDNPNLMMDVQNALGANQRWRAR